MSRSIHITDVEGDLHRAIRLAAAAADVPVTVWCRRLLSEAVGLVNTDKPSKPTKASSVVEPPKADEPATEAKVDVVMEPLTATIEAEVDEPANVDVVVEPTIEAKVEEPAEKPSEYEKLMSDVDDILSANDHSDLLRSL